MELRTEGEVTVHVDAPPEHVYALVSDVTRTGEWSPECRRCVWVEGATGPAPGARFRGWNRSGLVRWSRLVEVVAAHPDREFGWRTLPDRFNKDSTTWRYRLAAEDGGTRLTQTYAIAALPRFPVNVVMRLFLRHHADMRPHMRQSLERIKATAEAEATVLNA
ncbi:MAG: SRPBCC family protein [Actinomycetota bacterium]